MRSQKKAPKRTVLDQGFFMKQGAMTVGELSARFPADTVIAFRLPPLPLSPLDCLKRAFEKAVKARAKKSKMRRRQG